MEYNDTDRFENFFIDIALDSKLIRLIFLQLPDISGYEKSYNPVSFSKTRSENVRVMRILTPFQII
ncbi:hypothetical protein DK846_03950 [Methanospirillum lacunae]|uniref:Uncharacterized protein n=1 Tax=Methanospirillum lacunae TaxID=668570 RepID=A0A2V2ND20_9EURY|nr:hypothetical protein DK846_03950 [Methanospirillum lacunae]